MNNKDIEDVQFIYDDLGGNDMYYALSISKENGNPILEMLSFWKRILDDVESLKREIQAIITIKVHRPTYYDLNAIKIY